MTPTAFKEVRQSLGLATQYDTAQFLGYSRQGTISNWESGKDPIPKSVAMLLQAMADTGWRPDDWPK